jgi:antirestriction protein
MITLWLRELSTHNNGYSLDKKFDLDDYTSSQDMLDELFEYTKESIEEIDSENLNYYNFEEWMITDYEFEDNIFSFIIGDYDSLDKLLELNEALSDLDNGDKIKYIALINNGYEHNDAMDNIEDCIIFEVENTFHPMSDLAYDFVEDGYFGDVPENIKIYLDYEKMGRDLEINGTFIQVDYEGNSYIVEIL